MMTGKVELCNSKPAYDLSIAVDRLDVVRSQRLIEVGWRVVWVRPEIVVENVIDAFVQGVVVRIGRPWKSRRRWEWVRNRLGNLVMDAPDSTAWLWPGREGDPIRSTITAHQEFEWILRVDREGVLVCMVSGNLLDRLVADAA